MRRLLDWEVESSLASCWHFWQRLPLVRATAHPPRHPNPGAHFIGVLLSPRVTERGEGEETYSGKRICKIRILFFMARSSPGFSQVQLTR